MKMKVSVKLARITKLISIDDEKIEDTTISDIQEKIKVVFPEIESQSFQLSLNKKDPIQDVAARLSDIGIVSGDLIYIIGTDVEHAANSALAVSTAASTQLRSSLQPSKNLYRELTKNDTDESKVISSHQYSKNEQNNCSDTSKLCKDNMVNVESELMETNVAEETEEDRLLMKKLLREPRLCRDSTVDSVPFLLEEMYSAFDVCNACEALVIAHHVLMLEMGFIPTDGQQGEADEFRRNISSQILFRQWKSMGCYKIPYTHTGCEELRCCVTAVPMGSTLVVHGVVSDADNDRLHQLQVRVADYVKHSPATKEVAGCYRNLPELSRLFKDAIGLPLLQDLRAAKGLHCTDGLLALVHEVKLQILCYLDMKSIVSVSEVCRELHTLSRDPCLWRGLYIRDFDSLSRRNALSQDWYEFYKSKFKLDRERREALRHMTFVTPPLGIAGRANPPFPWVPIGPGMIGGDYDLNPDIHGIRDPLFGRNRGNCPGGPLAPSPRFDPLGPLPDMAHIRGRRGGLYNNRGINRQPRFF